MTNGTSYQSQSNILTYLLQKASRFPPLPLADMFRASLTRTWRAPLKEITGAERKRDSKLRSLGTYFKARNNSPR